MALPLVDGEENEIEVELRIEVGLVFFFKQKTAYEIGTGDWSSDVCSSDLAIQQGDKNFFVSKSFETYGGLIPSTSRISIPSFVILR